LRDLGLDKPPGKHGSSLTVPAMLIAGLMAKPAVLSVSPPVASAAASLPRIELPLPLPFLAV
jgi:hypothetical protein